MTPRQAFAVRLAVLGVVAVLVQLAAVGQLSISGVSPDVVPLVVASVGLLCGSIPGALFGFGAGLLVDMALWQTLGVDSLLYVLAGYGAGRLREVRDPSNPLLPLAAGAGATAVVVVGFSLVQFLLGVNAPVSFLLVRQILVTIILGALLALPVHALVRRVLRRALAEEHRRGSRRAAERRRPGLSPLIETTRR